MSTAFKSGLSRRSFLSSLGAASVAATSLRGFAAVQGVSAPHPVRGVGDSDALSLDRSIEDEIVFISMNENPLGPAQSALDAICKMAAVGNRYHGEVVQATVSTALDLSGLKRGYVGLFPGSVGPLNLALMSHIGPGKALVYGDPSYEQAPALRTWLARPSSPSSSPRPMRTM